MDEERHYLCARFALIRSLRTHYLRSHNTHYLRLYWPLWSFSGLYQSVATDWSPLRGLPRLSRRRQLYPTAPRKTAGFCGHSASVPSLTVLCWVSTLSIPIENDSRLIGTDPTRFTMPRRQRDMRVYVIILWGVSLAMTQP